MTKKARGRGKFCWVVGTLCLMLAGALPGIANAYWACVSTSDGGCYTLETCQEYNDCTDKATGRQRATLYRDIC